MASEKFNISGSPARALTAATLGFFFGAMAISLFGPTAKALSTTMGLTPAEVGLLVAVPSLSGSLLRIPFGASGRRLPASSLSGFRSSSLPSASSPPTTSSRAS